MTRTGDPAPDQPPKLEVTKVVIDLRMGLFAFTYADDITEHIQIRDHTDLPTVAQLVTALVDEVATYGRPQPTAGPTTPEQ